MASLSWFRTAALAALIAAPALAGTFGRVVAIGGHASDLALDEPRGVLYVANFGASRVDVVSLASATVQSSINVGAQPSSVSVSPGGQWLAVTQYGNTPTPGTPTNALTVVNLETRAQRRLPLAAAPLGVAFAHNNRALVVTAKDFQLLDPEAGTLTLIDTLAGVISQPLPSPPPLNFPLQITSASLATSGNGRMIMGLSDAVEFFYDVDANDVLVLNYTSKPPQGPRVVSMNHEGTYWTSGWTHYNLLNAKYNQFPNASGALNIGSHVIDSRRNLIYAQIPKSTGDSVTAVSTEAPVLQVVEVDSLTVRERLQLPENLAGRSVMSADSSTMYAISDSGVMILPVGALGRTPRVAADVEDLVFRTNSCQQRMLTQEFTVNDLGGAGSDVTVTSGARGVRVLASSGTAPARITVIVDPAAFNGAKGTVSVPLTISSNRAVNLPEPVRVLVNLRDPDQRGAVLNVPGKLVDVVPHPYRDRFFVLRQDRNAVLVFDGNLNQVATLRTGNTPTQMTISHDRRWLLVGHDNAKFISVFDVETLEESWPVIMTQGHYPRSVASGAAGTLAASRVAGPRHEMVAVDLERRVGERFTALGPWENNISIDTVLVASPNGSSIMAAQSDGALLMWHNGEFTVNRKDIDKLAGPYAADNFGRFFVGNSLLNVSGVPVGRYNTAGNASGFLFLGDQALRTTAAETTDPGLIERMDAETGGGVRPVRLTEAPLVGSTAFGFTRTLAVLPSRRTLVALTVSGVTALPITYDDAALPPRIERVVSATDQSANVTPGGLVSILGTDLSPVTQASTETPLPTVLGDSCLLVNGQPVPFLFVSPTQINAQLPSQAEGSVTLTLRTPGGVSDNFRFTVRPAAPALLRTATAGEETNLPNVYRGAGELVTASNPVRRGDTLSLFMTGLGRTTPEVPAGTPAPADPLALVQRTPVVSLGGHLLEVASAHLVPGTLGTYEVVARVTNDVPLGLQVPLTVGQGDTFSSVPVRVIEPRR